MNEIWEHNELLKIQVSLALHTIFMCDGLYNEPYYRNVKSKSHYTYAHNSPLPI